jgi:site-specific DNA recombinase
MTNVDETTTEQSTKRAVLYLRVSTTEQAHGDGSSEGYSIPAQREACRRKAHDLNAEVVAEFADRGESARSAARPELQNMLASLAEHKNVQYVIVHKVDRLARNRADDIAIQLAIKKAGAQLVSVTENVDDTPSGQLVHNIMADLAEFYSANLATEILKGSTQKARMGGTPYKAPIGYMNVRLFDGGRETRTVEVDPDRAPLVHRAFELFATSEYSLRQLVDIAAGLGLSARPAPGKQAVPIGITRLSAMLSNRYYLGLVSYRGIEHPGKHPAIIGMELFEQVQAILHDRERHAIKPRRHQHYLRGLLSCKRCGSRLLYTSTRNRHGDEFDYYLCTKRHRTHDCDLPYLPAIDIEERINAAWLGWLRLEKLDAETVRTKLQAELGNTNTHNERLARAEKRLARLGKERLKLVQMAYAEAIPLDLLKQEQARGGPRRWPAHRRALPRSSEADAARSTCLCRSRPQHPSSAYSGVYRQNLRGHGGRNRHARHPLARDPNRRRRDRVASQPKSSPKRPKSPEIRPECGNNETRPSL